MQDKEKPVDIEQKVKEAVAEALNIKFSSIKDDSNLAEDLGVDSFGVVEIAFAIKEKLGIEIPPEDTNDIKTVRNLIDYIISK